MYPIQACIFDLDGVIVDTAHYHFVAWRTMCQGLGFDITPTQNELLKGVSRTTSLDILLKIGNITHLTDAEKTALATKKNEDYLSYVDKMIDGEILAGITDFLGHLRHQNIKIALGSASKNAVLILEKVGLMPMFDAIIDGNQVTNAKPDPEIFLQAATALHTLPQHCVVFEDAVAGVQAALNAQMKVVGIGDATTLAHAHWVVPNVQGFTLQMLQEKLG
jgi:beta-phosphoglucomutase